MKIKKKIACLALVCALAIPGTIALAGCELGHTHDFNSAPFYEVVTEGGAKIARSWVECSCGAEDEHKKIENAVIVTPTTVQDALDGRIVLRGGNYVVTEKEATETYININDKVIVFDEGVYNDVIQLRPSKETATVYDANEYSGIEPENRTPITGELDINAFYAYERNFTNLTFVGTENAIFKNFFLVRTGDFSTSTVIFGEMYNDIVKNDNTFGKYRAFMSIDNLTISRLNFSGARGRVYISNGLHQETIGSININNCTFITDTPGSDAGPSQNNAAAYIVSWKNGIFGTINFTNNKVDGHFQGVYTQNADEVNVVGNDISNTSHNAIAVKSGSDSFTGIIKILNNKVSNTGDRAIRFGKCADTQIYVENNTINNGVDSDNELMKSEALTNTTYSLKNNTHNGELLEDIENDETPLLVTIIAE